MPVSVVTSTFHSLLLPYLMRNSLTGMSSSMASTFMYMSLYLSHFRMTAKWASIMVLVVYLRPFTRYVLTPFLSMPSACTAPLPSDLMALRRPREWYQLS